MAGNTADVGQPPRSLCIMSRVLHCECSATHEKPSHSRSRASCTISMAVGFLGRLYYQLPRDSSGMQKYTRYLSSLEAGPQQLSLSSCLAVKRHADERASQRSASTRTGFRLSKEVSRLLAQRVGTGKRRFPQQQVVARLLLGGRRGYSHHETEERLSDGFWPVLFRIFGDSLQNIGRQPTSSLSPSSSLAVGAGTVTTNRSRGTPKRCAR